MAFVIMGLALGQSGTQRQDGSGAVEGSATQSTRARSGGSRYRPTISRTLTSNWRMVRDLELLRLVGWISKRFQLDAPCATCRCLANVRTLHCVARRVLQRIARFWRQPPRPLAGQFRGRVLEHRPRSESALASHPPRQQDDAAFLPAAGCFQLSDRRCRQCQ